MAVCRHGIEMDTHCVLCCLKDSCKRCENTIKRMNKEWEKNNTGPKSHAKTPVLEGID